MNISNKEIGKRIMRVRKEQGYTQEALSELLGISKNHLSGIECGKYTATTPFIIKLCNVLGQTPDYYLLGQVSSSTDEIASLARRLPEKEQKLLIKIIQLFLTEE